jgi:hypothetical protein
MYPLYSRRLGVISRLNKLSIGEIFRLALSTRKEEYRAQLVRAYLDEGDKALAEIAKRVGGDAIPDTLIVRTSVETVLAALAYLKTMKAGRRLRIVAPEEPHEGWGPLNELVEVLMENREADVYRVQMTPSVRIHVRDVARKVGRMLRGFSARIVDVTDAPGYIGASLYAAGVRTVTVLVDAGYAAIFQKLNITMPL